jgi:predicted amidohydrolase YtcJ
MRWAEARLGPERVAGAYAWRRLPGAQAPLACGSDFPVESPDPLLGLYAARTRQDAQGNPPGGWLADQRLDGRSALAGFTSGAAYAAHEEQHRGKLLPGYAADVTVLSVDPIRCEPRELREARVLATIVDGELVHSAFPKD